MKRTVYHETILAGMIILAVMSPLTGEARPRWAGAPLERGRNNRATPCDWLEVHARFDGPVLRLAYRCTAPIDFGPGAAAYSIYFDTDGNRRTGFRGGDDDFPIGADYMLQGGRVYRYVGDEGPRAGLDWAWTLVDAVEYRLDGEWAEFTLKPEHLAIRHNELRFFLFGDNTAENVGGNHPDYLPERALRAGGGGRHIRLAVPDDAFKDDDTGDLD